MRSLITLAAVVGISVGTIGCGEAKKEAPKPATPPKIELGKGAKEARKEEAAKKEEPKKEEPKKEEAAKPEEKPAPAPEVKKEEPKKEEPKAEEKK